MKNKQMWALLAIAVLASFLILAMGCDGNDDDNDVDGDISEMDADDTDIVDVDDVADGDMTDPDPDVIDGDVDEAEEADIIEEAPETVEELEEDAVVEQEEEVAVEQEPEDEIPAGHTDVVNGVPHYPGKDDALSNCTGCHGSDLSGGFSGQSCYECHNNSDHTLNRDGVNHNTGSSSTCTACHGPQNSGGLGPACSDCH